MEENLHHINHTTHWFCVSECCTDLDLCKYWYNRVSTSKIISAVWSMLFVLQSHRNTAAQGIWTPLYLQYLDSLFSVCTSSSNYIYSKKRKKKKKKSELVYFIWHLPLRKASWHLSLNNESQKFAPESLSKIHDLDFN